MASRLGPSVSKRLPCAFRNIGSKISRLHVIITEPLGLAKILLKFSLWKDSVNEPIIVRLLLAALTHLYFHFAHID
jgi:hypothetical protein